MRPYTLLSPSHRCSLDVMNIDEWDWKKIELQEIEKEGKRGKIEMKKMRMKVGWSLERVVKKRRECCELYILYQVPRTIG